MHWNKRYLLIGLLVLIVPLVVACSDDEEEAVTLKLAHFLPAGHHLIRDFSQPFAAEIERRTAGKVRVEEFPGGSLVGATAQYDAVVDGTIQLSICTPGLNPGVFPLSEINELPFGLTSATQAGKVFGGIWEKHLQDEWKDVKALGFMSTPPFPLFLRGDKVTKPEDFKGLKVRSLGTTISKGVEQLGGTPVSVGALEIYSAAEKGIVDAVLMGGSPIAYGVEQVTKYWADIPFGAGGYVFCMNQNAFDDLTKDQQEIVEGAGKKAAQNWAISFEQDAVNAKKDYEAAGGEVYQLTPDQQAAFEAAVKPVWEGWVADRGAAGQAVFDEFNRLRVEMG